MASQNRESHNFVILGAGVIGLTTSLVLRHSYPNSNITIVAKYLPGDRSIEYTSPWAGANWSSMAHDNGPLEKYDEVTFKKFGDLVDGGNVHGCRGGAEVGLGEIGMWGIFDSKIEDAGILTPETGKVWYQDLCGVKPLPQTDLPRGAVFGLDFEKTFRINTQVYLNWLQDQALGKNIKLMRRHYSSITELLVDFPSTSLLVNCSALGSLKLSDVQDTNLYPTRGQTVLVAEPKTPLPRLYVRSPKRIDPTTTYVFPRPLGGGVILGGSRQDGDWSQEVDVELAKEIMQRCCELAPQLGKPEDLQVISHNVGLRPTRKGGPRIETQVWGNGIPVVHNYGHAGAGYQSSWGVAERALELVQQALEGVQKHKRLEKL